MALQYASLPDMMNAIGFITPGGPDCLVVQRHSVPKPGNGELLVRIAAAGVNRPDVLQRQGAYPPPPGASDILGLEFSGIVVALGDGVSRFQIGDEVCALVSGGAYTDYACVHESNALGVPTGLSLVEAAGIPETFFTVWTNVFMRAGLKSGETFLVHGGSSGIGTTAIMLAKVYGARVMTTAGSDERCAACIKLGADVAVNYKTQDFVAVVKAATNKHGADVILDMVGGSYINRNYDVAAESGRIVQIAFLENPKAEVDFRRLMMKRLSHTGSTLRIRTIAQKAAIADELREKVWPLIASGQCKPVIDTVMPMHEAAKAHALMESGAHFGKIILVNPQAMQD